jgi:LPXTG-site transpeptidase (sortase) family protein
VTFQDPGVNIPGCIARPIVAGVAVCTHKFAVVGSYSVTAIYNGDPNFLTSASVSVAELILPGLPNTSGPQAGIDAVKPIPSEPMPGLWLAMLAFIAGVGALVMMAGRLRGNHVRFRRRRRRQAFSTLPLVLCLALGLIAGSQSMMYPAAGSTSAQAASDVPVKTAAGLTPDTVLIGNKVVTVAKPAPPGAESFHPATGPIWPTRLRIPSIGVDAQVVAVGLLSDGLMDVPDNLWTTAWLSIGARPGQPGPSVIAGHRGIGIPGVFGHLENVRPGDRIFVSDAAGGELVYEVTMVTSVEVSPGAQVDVFGPTSAQRLVLITCFGQYNDRTRTSDHRLVVFSRLLPPNA